jgi:hypothetical protein
MDGRVNLINLLLEGISNGQITPYDARLDDDFKVPMTYEQVKEALELKSPPKKRSILIPVNAKPLPSREK